MILSGCSSSVNVGLSVFVLGTFFMLSMIYLAYGYINDWKGLSSNEAFSE